MTAAAPHRSGLRWRIVCASALLYLPLLLLVLAASSLADSQSGKAYVARILARPPREVPSLPVWHRREWPGVDLARDPFASTPVVVSSPATSLPTADGPRLVATYRQGSVDFALMRSTQGLAARAVGDAWGDGRIGEIWSNGIAVDIAGHREFVPIGSGATTAGH